jgi:preprotein translocase subunit SecF
LAYTLLVGFAVGTYSSIFIASPLMIWWYRRFGAGRALTPGTAAMRTATADAPSGAQI